MRSLPRVFVLALVAHVAHADNIAARPVEFRVTGGTPAARAEFQRGILALHSFWYEEARARFAAAVQADPTFAMGRWGLAFSQIELLWFEDDLPAARDSLAKITAVDKLSPRERAWIDATRTLAGAGNQLARRKAFAEALARMHRDDPDDDEIASFYALALLASTSPVDPDELAMRGRAGGLAMQVFLRSPRHPGAAHYLIHALDTPELAPLALPAAQVYAGIAPEAYHARHMPAHIFSRLGLWGDALKSCQSAWEVSATAAASARHGSDAKDFHSQSWIMEIDFQLGRRKDAEASLKLYGDEVRGGLGRLWRSGYADEVARFIELTQEWDRVDELLAPLSAPVPKADAGAHVHGATDLEKIPFDLFEKEGGLDARLAAAAGRRDAATLEQLLADWDRVDDQLRAFREHQSGKEDYARHITLHALRRQRLLARAAGDDVALLDALRKTAEIVDKRPSGEEAIFDGGVHELIADALLRLKRGKEALTEYQIVLRRHLRYARGLLGAARAAAAAGDATAAKGYYAQVVDVWANADADMPGLAEARAAR
jgi:hypothetical protein